MMKLLEINMDLDLEYKFNTIPSSTKLIKYIENQAKMMNRAFMNVNKCRVSIDLPHNRCYSRNLYKIQIEVETEKNRVVVKRSPAINGLESSIYSIIHDAFLEVERKLNKCTLLLTHIKASILPIEVHPIERGQS